MIIEIFIILMFVSLLLTLGMTFVMMAVMLGGAILYVIVMALYIIMSAIDLIIRFIYWFLASICRIVC